MNSIAIDALQKVADPVGPNLAHTTLTLARTAEANICRVVRQARIDRILGARRTVTDRHRVRKILGTLSQRTPMARARTVTPNDATKLQLDSRRDARMINQSTHGGQAAIHTTKTHRVRIRRRRSRRPTLRRCKPSLTPFSSRTSPSEAEF